MQIPVYLKSKIAILGELSRPLGEARAARIAELLARDVARDVVHSRNPEETINAWIRQIAAEILEKSKSGAPNARKTGGHRPVSEILPEVAT